MASRNGIDKKVRKGWNASEERYRYLYESAHEIHLCIDLKGTLLDANQAGLDLLGYTKEDVIGKSFRRFVPVKYVPVILKNLALDAVGRTSPVMEIEIKAKDGRLIPVEFAPGSVPLYEDEKLVGVMVSARDVSYRLEAERALRESQERYELCTRAGKVGVWDWDIANGTFYLDPEIKGFLGYTDEEIPNDLEKWVTYVHPDDNGPVMKAAQDCLDGKTPEYVYEHRMVHKDGSVRWVRVDGTVIRDKKGEPIRMLGTDTDITERKLAEEELARHRQHLEEVVAERTENLKKMSERYHTLFESVPVGIGIATRDGRPIAGNSTICALMGYTVEELKGASISDLYHDPADRERIMRLLSQDGIVRGERVEMVRKDGTTFVASLTVIPFPAEGENVTFTLIEDITERVRSEERMRWQLMRFRLDEGCVYLVKESAPTIAMEAFVDLMKAGHPGHVISRTPPAEHSLDRSTLSSFMWLAEIEAEGAVPPSVDALGRRLDALPERSAVLIDRLDYLALKNGPDATLGFVHHIRELAYLRRHIIVLSLDPAAVDKHILHLLEKETQDVERQIGDTLGEDLLEVLRYVRRENIAGVKPSYTLIAGGVGLSRPTVLVRMKRLVAAGYVVVHKTGRRKAVELTERGLRLFER